MSRYNIVYHAMTYCVFHDMLHGIMYRTKCLGSYALVVQCPLVRAASVSGRFDATDSCTRLCSSYCAFIVVVVVVVVVVEVVVVVAVAVVVVAVVCCLTAGLSSGSSDRLQAQRYQGPRGFGINCSLHAFT